MSNKHVMQVRSDFIVTENYHVRLTEKAAKMLLERISLNFKQKASGYKHGKAYTYQNILLDNVQRLANYVLDKNKDPSFNVPPIQLLRNDSLNVQNRILSMTPEQRKALKINKSTLWYQKRNLAQAKKIKAYSKVAAKLR